MSTKEGDDTEAKGWYDETLPWVPFQESGQRLTQEELDRVEMMPKYTLNNAHFFCETADITRPFPSSRRVEEPSWEFVWNRWLAASLRSICLPGHCPHLLQVSTSAGT